MISFILWHLPPERYSKRRLPSPSPPSPPSDAPPAAAGWSLPAAAAVLCTGTPGAPASSPPEIHAENHWITFGEGLIHLIVYQNTKAISLSSRFSTIHRLVNFKVAWCTDFLLNNQPFSLQNQLHFGGWNCVFIMGLTVWMLGVLSAWKRSSRLGRGVRRHILRKKSCAG